ncbi:MAG: SufD family Fe-S cluster assembly protein [Acidimicrobiia bacterium]
MWLFGLFVANGSIDLTPHPDGGIRSAKVVFSLPGADRARDRLVSVMGDLMPGTKPYERADGVTLTWNSVELAELLLENGFETGAAARRVPSWVTNIPESQRLEFLAGYLDGDGTAMSKRRGLSAKSVSRVLLEDMAKIATTLGIPAAVHTEFAEERSVTILGYEATARGAHRLDLRADGRLVDRLSAGLQEVVDSQAEPKTRHFRSVGRSGIQLPSSVEIRPVAISEAGVAPTWDIEVEGTGNFISEGFIVHNSKLTMKYPAVWLMEDGAHGEVLSIAFAGEGQHQDAGAKIVHVSPNTTSLITSKSISKSGGRAGYRGLVRVEEGAEHARSFVRCDALILDEDSRSDTYPYMEVEESDIDIGHEATVSKVGEEQLFYLMTRGLTEEEATAMIVAGFIEPIVKELPMEYAVELNRLIELQMEGSIG